ncbi:MAG: IscS subfamily cysteine desulfurase [Bacteroidia bacterium]|nr:IscS subfamily cysteine desulfurase [Bacteroidia bacterium]
MNKLIYLDYNSTTPVDDRVLKTMLPYFSEKFGNAASKTHALGWVAEEAVKNARERVAQLINCTEQELIFTSGATEAINLAIKGVYEAYQTKGKHLVVAATEHKAVLDTCKALERKGAEITYLPVDREGLIDLNQLSNSIIPSTILVCVMFANNETGVIQPIEQIAAIVHSKGSIFMSDATQAVGKVNVDVQAEGIDLLCLSAHKLYGPKGAGALYVRRKNPRVTLAAQIHGGGHERGLRSGTLNVPAVVGLGKACDIAKAEMWDDAQRISKLRTLLEQSLLEIDGVFVNGSQKNRLPNVTNLSFTGIKADSLIAKLQDIAISTGSACSSAIPEPSHVLMAMGLTQEQAYSAIRFSLGKYTTEEEVKIVISIIREKLNTS